jgi:protein-S-isoprenylcysteine O-methyltransferase Ste14
MQTLETKVPPPVLVLLLGAFAYVASRWFPALAFHLSLYKALGTAIVTAGLALNVYPKLAFKRAGTSVNPLRPALATQLVTSGFYRYTRNPMYLGYGFVLLGWVLLLQNGGEFVVVPVFVLYISRFQIRPEERYLSARFPEEFSAFCKKVPRWL